MSNADSTRCKAIAISTGQRCTRKGKLDGYCSEKHREQADVNNGLWGLNRPQLFTDSEDESNPAPATPAKKTIKITKTKVEGIKKSSDAKDVAHPEPAPAASTPAKDPKPAAKPAKSTVSPKKAPAKKAATKKVSKAKKRADSSDEFEPDSDESYEPNDSDRNNSGSNSDNDDSDEDDLKEVTGKLASVKIKSDDPTLKPNVGSSPMKSKIERAQSKIFNTGAVLAPPKNKASSATGRPSSGFWVPAPAPVKVPESTIKALATVKDKLTSSDSPTEDKKGLFKYSARVHTFLFANDDDVVEDPTSKRRAVRKLFKSLIVKLKGDAEVQEKPLPELPVETKTPSQQSKPSDTSVDSITQEISSLSVKSEDSQDEVPNQCHGFNSNGHRCKRRVKLDRPVTKGEVLMCHDHEVNDDEEVVVFIEGKGGVLLQWLDLSSWVNPNLPDYVQNKLKIAMEKPVSETDKPGYIYAYQLLESRVSDTHTFFKVGRTDNVYRRMSEWSDKCGSPPRLLEVFPEQGSLAPKDESDLSETATKTANDTDITGLRCRYAHRVERLIHIELKPLHDKDHVCACKTNHREWFKVPHQPGLSESQQLKQAWTQVRRIIVHWMAYMEHVYGPG
ncbi:meiotically up-regulated gene 113-domain-containing protein [Mortierella sp. GBAus27b]|nr:hypothetical protein BGX31_000004 [Mortierella sp. GBA43]KAI8351948.1 meiotically up-regulated gene 113-domain-containing protein [Mortierella sp. GBAus27b]